MVDLLNEASSDWNAEFLFNICERQSTLAILNLEWPSVVRKDELLWTEKSSGVFSVKEAYKVIVGKQCGKEPKSRWSRLWKNRLHEKLKLHLWRMRVGVLLTTQALFHIFGDGNPLCDICGEHEEMTLHLFFHCPFAKVIASDVEHLVSLCYSSPMVYRIQLNMNDFSLVFFFLHSSTLCDGLGMIRFLKDQNP